MTPKYRLLFLDIDGTILLPTGEISDRTAAALHRSRQYGCVIVLCTGRSRHSAERVAKLIGGTGYGIVLNGALVFDWATGEILRLRLMPLDVTHLAVITARRHGMSTVWLGAEENDARLFADSAFPLVPEYVSRNADRLVLVDDLAANLPGQPASLAAYGSETATTALAADWRLVCGAGVRVFAGPTSAYGCWYAQITEAEGDKAHAAEAVAARLGVPREETLAIGDHLNDCELLRWAGLGVAMRDGHPQALAAADVVTGAVCEDGAAAAIERFVLTGAAGGNGPRSWGT